MTPAEEKQYAHLLVDQLLDEQPDAAVLATLERHFTVEQLGRLKVVALECVRIRNDIDERMRQYRAGAARAAA